MILRRTLKIRSSKADIRKKGIRYRQYRTTDNFVNVAPWAATDFSSCGNDPVDYFAEQEPFRGVDRSTVFAIHGDHVHVITYNPRTGRIIEEDERDMGEKLNQFIGWLKGKGINLLTE
jgi:hypothetical protein